MVACRVQVVEPVEVVLREARARAMGRRREHDRPIQITTCSSEIPSISDPTLEAAQRLLAEGGAHRSHRRLIDGIALRVWVVEAEDVPDLMRCRGLEVKAFDTR